MKPDPKRGRVSALRRSMTAEQWQRHWQAVKDQAQLDTHTEISGKQYARLPYGTKGEALYPECPDCAVRPGQLHVANCDTEVCPACGDHALGCDCAGRELH
jgi:hypothetical protein